MVTLLPRGCAPRSVGSHRKSTQAFSRKNITRCHLCIYYIGKIDIQITNERLYLTLHKSIQQYPIVRNVNASKASVDLCFDSSIILIGLQTSIPSVGSVTRQASRRSQSSNVSSSIESAGGTKMTDTSPSHPLEGNRKSRHSQEVMPSQKFDMISAYRFPASR